jgi:hypothetical protein
MIGLKLFAVCALVGNDPSTIRPNLKPAVQETVAVTVSDEPVFGRRKALEAIFLTGAVASVGIPGRVQALDMDAFSRSELEKDQRQCNPKLDPKCAPKMTADEALCKYGQSGNARAEACKKFKSQGGQLPTITKEKSLGGAYAI